MWFQIVASAEISYGLELAEGCASEANTLTFFYGKKKKKKVLYVLVYIGNER